MITIIASSCDKVEELKDEISFRLYDPYLELNPADSVAKIYAPSCYELIPSPSDSVVSVAIDVDKDGFNDFEFTYSTYYKNVSPFDACENHNSSIKVKAFGVENRILVEDVIFSKVRVYSIDDELSMSNPVSSEAVIYLDDASSSEAVTLESGNKYIGVRLASGRIGWIKIAHKLETFTFTIMEHAYNKNLLLNIKAGQKN